MKMFILLGLLMSVIFAQTTSAVDTDDEDDDGVTGEDDDDDDDEGEDEDGEEILEEEAHDPPALICTLFGTEACSAGCLTVGTIYGIDSLGQCDELHSCKCSFLETTSLDDLWSRKFSPKSVLPQIKRDETLSQLVLDMLRQSMASSQETKQKLKVILRDNLYEKILIKDDAPASRIPQPDGKFDLTAVTKLATRKLKPFITDEYPKKVDYKKSLSEALNTREDYAVQHLIREVRLTGNPVLIEIIDEFLKSNENMEAESTEERPEDIADFVDHHIINQLIKETQSKSKSKPKPKPKPKPGSNAKKPNLPRPNQSPANSGGSRPTPSQDFTLPDKSMISKQINESPAAINKSWQGTNYQVRFRRLSPKGDAELWWSKGNDHVYLHRHFDGSVDQNWNFDGKVMIGLHRDADNSQVQMWQFGQTRLEVINPPPQRAWEYNNRDEGSYTKYTQIIESWCKANDFFVGKESCVIF